jgi:hypothetical protein
MQFQTRTQQPSTIAELANVSSAGIGLCYFIPLLQNHTLHWHFTFYLLFVEETLVNQPMESSSPQHALDSPMAQPSSPQAEISSFPRIQSPLPQVEIPVSPEMTPPSLQPKTSNLPGTAPASSQAEVSALPGTPQTPLQLVTQEIPLEPEQTPAPTQETRHEVSAGTQLYYFLSINHP